MQCPMCIQPLLESFRHTTGVELDVCPTCRGAWLDRGELEQLLSNHAGPPSQDRVPAALVSDQRAIEPASQPSRRKRRIFHEVREFFD